MPICTYKKRKHRKICIAELDTEIILQSRDIASPVGNSVDFVENFTGSQTLWALSETSSGKTIFDSSNTERDLTNIFYIRFIVGITSENWITLNGNRIDIITVENYEERNEFLVLRCSNRGSTVNLTNEL